MRNDAQYTTLRSTNQPITCVIAGFQPTTLPFCGTLYALKLNHTIAIAGLEPALHGIKARCLTIWLYC